MKNKMISLFKSVKEGTVKMYNEAKKHLVEICATVAGLIPASTVNAFATTEVVTNSQAEQLIGGVLNVIFLIFRYIGILLLAWSIGMLVLAFKNEDADSKSRAIMMMVVSVILISVRTLFDALGVI